MCAQRHFVQARRREGVPRTKVWRLRVVALVDRQLTKVSPDMCTNNGCSRIHCGAKLIVQARYLSVTLPLESEICSISRPVYPFLAHTENSFVYPDTENAVMTGHPREQDTYYTEMLPRRKA